MSSISSSFARAPNLLFSQTAYTNLTQTSLSLLEVQTELATGRSVNRFSDDAVRAATVSIIDDRLERSEQRLRNLDHASTSLNILDNALGEANDLVLEAKNIASAQLGAGSTDSERQSQSLVVASMLENLFGLANRQSIAGYAFGGTHSSTPPVLSTLGGYRYTGEGTGLATDIGLGRNVAVTLGANHAFGATSARLEGTVDLNPNLTGATRLSDVAGARGLGVTLGPVEFALTGGPRATVDLSEADTAQDIADALTGAIRTYETDAGVTVLGPGGVSFSGGCLAIDVAPGAGGPNPELEFFDVGTGVTAKDLGLAGETPFRFAAGAGSGTDIRPKVTWASPVATLAGVAGGLGSIRVRNNGQARDLDLSAAATVEDIRNAIEGAGLGLRVEINAAGDGINVVNEIAAGRDRAMSIEELPGSNLTATRLGIRSFAADTRLADFHDGRGVQVVNGSVDPQTGLPDPARDVDFTITLGDAGATVVAVDLRPEDVVTVQTLIDRINAQASAQGVNVPGDFEAGLSDGANGLMLTQNGAFTGSMSVARENNSPSFDQLGLASGSYDAASATFRCEDCAKVRVNNLFSHLIDLRDALASDDTGAISLAAESLEASVERVAETRALVGGYTQRVEAATLHEEDQALLDEKTRSELRDLDYTEAAIRLNLLQTQLAAGLRSTATASSLSLLDFLG